MSFYLAIDVGGTSIKFGLVSEAFQLVDIDSISTQDKQETADDIVKALSEACLLMLERNDLSPDSLKAVGVGLPGTAINHTGTYVFAGNLPFKNYPFRAALKKTFSCPIFLGNDANVAGLAESRLGAGNGAKNSVTLTLGTGMGAGVIINDRIYSGFNETGCEFGHTTLISGGEYCTCGRRGCFEAYVSATALIRQTQAEIEAAPESLLAKIASEDGKVTGMTAFKAWRSSCPVGTAVVEQYGDYLVHGIANVINSYMPEVIILGGGISHEGEDLVKLCEQKAIDEAFIFGDVTRPKIVLAALGNKAGVLGAALFAEDCLKDHAQG